MTPTHPVPSRIVEHAEALQWLSANPASKGTSVVTSLPDVSELTGLDFDAWRQWFVRAAALVMRWLPPAGTAVFFQSDIRFRGLWIDKAQLILEAAALERFHLLWHSIVCRLPPGTVGRGRASYSHMLCLSRVAWPPRYPPPDVLPDAGTMLWSKAMGVEACRQACLFLARNTDTSLIADPFCGVGTTLAVANSLGLDSIGIELSARRCRRARSLRIPGADDVHRSNATDG